MDHALQARRRARFLGTLIALSLCALGVTAIATAGRDDGGAPSWGHPKGGTQKIREITVLSNRADLISGGRRTRRHRSR